ncbi:Gfo/Idh/MocA family protein [Bacillus sp. FSL K6-3431]|uniref:Gfo/Idh/MocA family protein n=1 Tax=Bacillus sp. FSL K6-3431 TaxID=2921500 RepID=UPI0030F843E1
MSKHRIVVAGCGGMSNTWFDYLAERIDAQVVALVDVHIPAAEAMAKKRGLNVPLYSDLGEAIKESDANLVFDITIPKVHKEIVTTALKAGCHVFGEKPIAETLADAKEVVDAAGETGNTYSVMQNRRFNSQIRAFQQLLEGRTVGTIGSLHADFFLGPHFGGFRDVMDSPLIVDMAIHTFDQARFLMGADPVSVYCHEYNPPGSWYKGNASAICIFEMSDGSVFTYRGSWCAEGFETSWEGDWRAIGEFGTVRWDGEQLPICEIVDETQSAEFMKKTKSVDVPDMWKGREGHWGCLDEMFTALEQNRQAETDCTDNIKSMAMVFGAVESARTGQKVLL